MSPTNVIVGLGLAIGVLLTAAMMVSAVTTVVIAFLPRSKDRLHRSQDHNMDNARFKAHNARFADRQTPAESDAIRRETGRQDTGRRDRSGRNDADGAPVSKGQGTTGDKTVEDRAPETSSVERDAARQAAARQVARSFHPTHSTDRTSFRPGSDRSPAPRWAGDGNVRLLFAVDRNASAQANATAQVVAEATSQPLGPKTTAPRIPSRSTTTAPTLVAGPTSEHVA